MRSALRDFHVTDKRTRYSNYVNTTKKKKVMFPTKGNGSGSSLVKELKGYDEEAIRSTQHWFKCQELLERDQPVCSSKWKKKQQKTMLNIYFNMVNAEFKPLIQTKQPELSPQWHVKITLIRFDPTEMPKRFWRENKNTVIVTATIANLPFLKKIFNSDHYACVVCTCVTQHPSCGSE